MNKERDVHIPKPLLPIVSQEVCFSVAAELLDETRDYVLDVLSSISDENPVLDDHIGGLIEDFSEGDPKRMRELLLPVALVYATLRSQAEADSMARSLDIVVEE